MKPPLASERHERGLLGCGLLEPSAIPVVRHLLTKEHFTTTPAQVAWAYFCACLDGGQEITHQGLTDELERRNCPDSWGWVNSLIDEWTADPNQIESLADILDERLVRRRMERAGKRLRDLAHKEEGDVRMTISKARSYLDALEIRCNGARSDDLSPEATRIWEIFQSPPEGQATALMTGLPSLDKVALLYGGQWVVIEGRTSEGKSTLAGQIALFNACLGRRGVVFSLEMQRWEYMLRLVAQRYGVPLDGLIRHYKGFHPRLTPEMQAFVGEALAEIGKLPLVIEDQGPWTEDAILGRASRLHAYAPLSFVVIDHLGLASYSGDNLRVSMKLFSNRIKQWANEKNVTVFGLMQMTDSDPGKVPGPPMLGQARDCRDVEQDSDLLLAPHRPGRWDASIDERQAWLCILKQRNGWTGIIRDLVWDGATTRFLDPSAKGVATQQTNRLY